MSERKRKRREWLDYLSATQAETPQRQNPFLCTICGVDAIWRHYAPNTGDDHGQHVASFCVAHSPMYTDTSLITV